MPKTQSTEEFGFRIVDLSVNDTNQNTNDELAKRCTYIKRQTRPQRAEGCLWIVSLQSTCNKLPGRAFNKAITKIQNIKHSVKTAKCQNTARKNVPNPKRGGGGNNMLLNNKYMYI